MNSESRPRALTRKLNWKHTLRKRTIARNILGGEYYPHLHQYSKNKIHCSCCMCSPRKTWGLSPNSEASGRVSDRRSLQTMKNRLEEANEQ